MYSLYRVAYASITMTLNEKFYCFLPRHIKYVTKPINAVAFSEILYKKLDTEQNGPKY